MIDLCKGIIPAILTPFTKTEEVDYKQLKKHTRRMLDAGVHGIFCLGTNGEFYALNETEKCKIVETVVTETNGEVPVYAGSGEIATRTVIHLTNTFKNLGASAVSIITPYFIAPTQYELYKHYGCIASETDIPVVLYNIPMRTHVNLDADTVRKLATAFPNIIGIKDSSADIALAKAYIEAAPNGFCVMGGNDGLILDTLLLGGTGAIAATANVIPEILVQIYNEFLAGNVDAARLWQNKVAPLRNDFKLGTSPGVIKVQANLCGYELGENRMPIVYDDPKVIETLKANLKTNYHKDNL